MKIVYTIRVKPKMKSAQGIILLLFWFSQADNLYLTGSI